MVNDSLIYVCTPETSWLIYSNKGSFCWEFFVAMKKLTKSMCWDIVTITKDRVNKVGIAIFQKPTSNECYEKRLKTDPPVCLESDDPNAAWYFFSVVEM